MLKHIVFIKLADRSPEKVEISRSKLADMEGKIPQLLHIEVGVDVVHSERSFDIALITEFESMEDMKAYQVHPVHQEVLAHLAEVKDTIVSVDFES